MAAKTSTKPLSQLKEEICDIGRRIYAKGFAAGNDGNISFRLGPDAVLCTPTMISKGFMKPSDLCIVDMEGKQIGGNRKRSSEILLHLTIMKERPDIRSSRSPASRSRSACCLRWRCFSAMCRSPAMRPLAARSSPTP